MPQGSRKGKFEKLTVEKLENLKTDMDPHLQEIVLAARAGQEVDSSLCHRAADGSMKIDVIARLKNPAAVIPGLNVVRRIGQIVTGTIDVASIETVRADANVLSLKCATRLHKDLEFSVHEIRATQDQLEAALPPGVPAVDGSGAIVGIVDYGCDFVHRDFRRADGATRLLFLWDQGGGQSSISPPGFGYGREFDAAAINHALQDPIPYQSLAYRPDEKAHGTHVMGIAAGNGRATNRPGVAPGADLIFVQVAAADYDEEQSFGNSRRLLEAVDYIFEKARQLGRSAVVNISLGTHGGPHDGSTLAEMGFDGLLATPGRAIVISAGNSWDRRSHAGGTIQMSSTRTIGWEISAGDWTDNELEVWYSGNAELEVTLITPSGQRLGPVPLGSSVNLNAGGDRVGRIIHRRDDPNNHDNQIDILLDRSLPAGTWGVELRAVSAGRVTFHAWIERDDYGQSQFAAGDSDPSHTVGSISCGSRTIVVGSYDARVPDRELSYFTSEGPTRDDKSKPEVSAPGHAILAPRSLSQGVTRMSGTSMASPHVTGVIALLMQAAGRPLNIEEIRAAIRETARDNPPAGSAWHPRYGDGRVDAVAAVLTQLEGAPISASRALVTRTVSAPVSTFGRVSSLDGLISVVAETARQSSSRIRVQIEVEP